MMGTRRPPQKWIWPPAQGNVAGAARVQFPDMPAFAAIIAPELARLFGVHVKAAASAGKLADAAGRILLARLPAAAEAAASAATEILASERHAGALADLLFGGLPALDAPAVLTRLPPGSASWTTLAEFVGRACAKGLESAGLACRLPVEVPPRAAPDAGAAAHMCLDLDFDGTPLQLGFRLPAAIEQVAAPKADTGWRHAVEDRTRAVALKVSLRIAAQRMRVGDVAALGVGDILPLDPPDSVDVLVAGDRFARLRIDAPRSPTTQEVAP